MTKKPEAGQGDGNKPDPQNPAPGTETPKPGDPAPNDPKKPGEGGNPPAGTQETEDEKKAREAKEAEAARIQGLKSEEGALKSSVEALRLEKRTLQGDPKPDPVKPDPAQPAAGAGDGSGDGAQPDEVDKKIQAATEPLKEEIESQRKEREKAVIKAISADPDMPFINVANDASNANFNRVKSFYVPRRGTASPEAIIEDFKDAYFAAFRGETIKTVSERAKQEGMAEALHNRSADTGGPGAGDQPLDDIVLTDAQKKVAKKLGISEDKYKQRLKEKQ